MRIERVPSWLVRQHGDPVREWLDAAVRAGKEETTEFVMDECEAGLSDFWLAFDSHDKMVGVFVTQVQHSPMRRVLEIRYLAGRDLKEWVVRQDSLIGWARIRGCEALRIKGRKGWLRFLPKWGWRPVAYEMELAI